MYAALLLIVGQRDHAPGVLRGDDELDYPHRQVLTSRNVRGGQIVDFALGGLKYQIEHHLFPSMPRPNLRRSQPLVRQYCAQHGIDYTQTGLFASYAQVLRHLRAVAVGAPSGAPPDRNPHLPACWPDRAPRSPQSTAAKPERSRFGVGEEAGPLSEIVSGAFGPHQDLAMGNHFEILRAVISIIGNSSVDL
jgi:Fatty acid desaturase